jgi:hypothetical protein
MDERSMTLWKRKVRLDQISNDHRSWNTPPWPWSLVRWRKSGRCRSVQRVCIGASLERQLFLTFLWTLQWDSNKDAIPSFNLLRNSNMYTLIQCLRIYDSKHVRKDLFFFVILLKTVKTPAEVRVGRLQQLRPPICLPSPPLPSPIIVRIIACTSPIMSPAHHSQPQDSGPSRWPSSTAFSSSSRPAIYHHRDGQHHHILHRAPPTPPIITPPTPISFPSPNLL